MRTVQDLLSEYVLTHDLAEETIDYYKRMISVLCAWARRRVPLRMFTVNLVNKMLVDKQRAGLSAYYRKSIRSAMRALLAFRLGSIKGQLRPVRVDPIEVEVWSAAEVQKLIDACRYMRDERKRRWWRTLIAVGYYCGFSNKDLWAIVPKNIDAKGIVSIRRSKTSRPVAMRIPLPWLIEIQPLIDGGKPIWGLPMARETFRQTFSRVVRKAGLTGSFKKLRKSCGTSVEMLHPGQGHLALGNTRRVFELHYFGRKALNADPMGPDALPEPPKGN